MPEVNRECLVKCKDCGSTITAEWRGFPIKKWRLQKSGIFSGSGCPQCHKKISLNGIETVLCNNCGRLVERTENGRCLSCNAKIEEVAIKGKIDCPQCGMLISVPLHPVGDFHCPICDYSFEDVNIDNEIKKKDVHESQYIQLLDEQSMIAGDYVIWKHPASEFPFKSRMQVSEGTIALFLQNGVCLSPREPGHYLLQDSELDPSEKLTAAFEGDDKVFRTDIFCVRKNLGTISWGASGIADESSAKGKNDGFRYNDEIWNKERTAKYRAGMAGHIRLEVIDARAFARFVGFREIKESDLTFVNLDIDDDPKFFTKEDGLLIRLIRETMLAALYKCLRDMTEDQLQSLTPSDVDDSVKVEANRSFDAQGLRITYLAINNVVLQRSQETLAADVLLDSVRSVLPWTVKGVHLHRYGLKDQSVDVNFSGNILLNIIDDKAFRNSPEAKSLMNGPAASSEIMVKDFYTSRVEEELRNILPVVGQERIDHGDISDILDKNQYAYTLRERVLEKLNKELFKYVLKAVNFSINLPDEIVKSDALTTAIDMPARRSAIRFAVESMLPLKTQPVRLHIRDDKSVYADMTFGGRVHLRVRDEEGFFQLTEIQEMLNNNQPISETSVRAYYVNRLNPMFEEILSRVAQSIVDQTNADIREMNRFTQLLKNSVQDSLSQRVEMWGLRVETLDLDVPVTVGESANFDKMILNEQTTSGIKLDEQLQKMQNDHVLFILDEDGRVKMHSMDKKSEVHQHEVDVNKGDTIHDMDAKSDINVHQKDIYGREKMHDADVDTDIEVNAQRNRDRLEVERDEARLRKLERDSTYELTKLQKGDELDRLADEIRFAKHERSDEAVLDEYKRKFRIREEQINEKIIEDRMLQEARIDLDMAAQRAEFEKKLADAENQRALNDIVHKIAESDLTWKQKLDEYDRLRKLTNSQNDAEIRQLLARADGDVKVTGARADAQIKQIEADTQIKISRDQEDAYYHAGDLKLKLKETEARILEQINLYDEQRKERIAAAADARAERRAILDFEQRMQDRREQVEQKIKEIEQRYEHELAMRDRDVDLEKFKDQLKYAAHEVSTKAGVSINHDNKDADIKINEAWADSEARVAEAEAVVERAKDQLKREEAIAKQAEEFRNQLLEIQRALEMTRLSNDRNRDDKLADVAIKTTEAVAGALAAAQEKPHAPTHGTDTKAGYDRLNRKMERVIDSVKDLKGKVDEMSRLVLILAASGGAGKKNGSRGNNNGGGSGAGQPQTDGNTMITCPLCGHNMTAGTRFCPNCGTPVISV